MLPEYSAAFWVCAVAAVVFVGIAKAGFGGGVGIIATPLMALTIPVADAAALMLPLLIVCDVFAVNHYRSRFHARSVKLLLPGAALGIGIGAFYFDYFSDNERALQIGLGVLSVVFVLFQLGRALIMGMLEERRPHASEGVAMGVIAGFTSTLAHAGGPPAAIYLLPQKLPRVLFVGTTVIFFAAVNVMKLVPYYSLGLLRPGNLMTTLLLAPLSYVGVRLGIYLSGHFSETWFNRLVYVILLLTGIQLIIGRSLILSVAR
jgi:uncharacterized protein